MGRIKRLAFAFLLCMFGAFPFSYAEKTTDPVCQLVLNVEEKPEKRMLHILSLWGARNRLPEDLKKEMHLSFKTNSVAIQGAPYFLQTYIVECEKPFSEEEFERLQKELIDSIDSPIYADCEKEGGREQIENITLPELNHHSTDLYHLLCFKMQLTENGGKLIELVDSRQENPSTPELQLVNEDAESRVAPFHALRLTPQDQKNIEKLIKNLGDKGYGELLYRKREMDKLGEKIHPVHPLRFMGYIMSRHDLKDRMRKVAHERLKWIRFVKGFGERMSHEKHHHQLLPYVPGFAQMLGVGEHEVEHYVHHSDWGGLIKFLL